MLEQINTTNLELQIKDTQEKSNNILITNEEQLLQATDFLGNVKKLYKNAEEERKEITKPLNDSLKAINKKYKIITEPLLALESKLKTLITAYLKNKDEQDRKIVEEERKLLEAKRIELEEQEKNANKEELALIETQKNSLEQQEILNMVDNKLNNQIRTENTLISKKKVWKFDVVDIYKIPNKYLILDEKKVAEDIRNGIIEIEGLKIYQEEIIAVR